MCERLEIRGISYTYSFMSKFFHIFILYVLLPIFSKAQGKAFINISVSIDDTCIAKIIEPQDSICDYGTIFYHDDDTLQTKSYEFVKNIQLIVPLQKGIDLYHIKISKKKKNENLRECEIALFNGDSIYLTLTNEENNGLKKVLVKGSNAFAHLYFLNNYFTLIKPGIYNNSDTTFDRFYYTSTHYIDSLMSNWDSLLEEKKISWICYNIYLTESKSNLYQQVLDELKRIYFRKNKLNYRRLALFLNYKDLVFYKSNAQNPRLLKFPSGFRLHNEYLKYILDIDPCKDTILNYSEFSYFFLYDTTYRERLWGNNMLNSYKDFTNTVWQSESDSDYMVFKHYYPNSNFNPRIERFISKYFQSKGDLLKTNTEEYIKLKKIFTNLPNRFIYIDLWATWCQPCIREFNYKNELKDSLNKMNVGFLMISEDKETDKAIWNNFLIKNKIKEYGIIADSSILNEINRLTNPVTGVPQYILFDKQTQNFYIDMPHPSARKYLYEKIREIILND